VEVLIGLVAPSATPPDILALLNREIGAILRRPDIGAAWAEQGAKPLPAAPAEWGTLLAEDVARWQRLIRANDIRP
jgi:tripartite-type tricarboxylate transporter receptor subunit TctC